MAIWRRPGTGATTAAEPSPPASPTSGKGRPTPKRAEARKQRRSPAPRTRKEAAAAQRDRVREQRRLQRQALVSGDERHLPPRDAGPARRLARDVVDSRFTYGQVFFALILGVLIATSVFRSPVVQAACNLAALLGLVLMVVDGLLVARRAKATVVERYGEGSANGVTTYAFMRALFPRRFRRPPPKVSRGSSA